MTEQKYLGDIQACMSFVLDMLGYRGKGRHSFIAWTVVGNNFLQFLAFSFKNIYIKNHILRGKDEKTKYLIKQPYLRSGWGIHG